MQKRKHSLNPRVGGEQKPHESIELGSAEGEEFVRRLRALLTTRVAWTRGENKIRVGELVGMQ